MCAFWCKNTRYFTHGQNCVIWMDDICGDMPGELPFSMHRISRSLWLFAGDDTSIFVLMHLFFWIHISKATRQFLYGRSYD